MKFGGYFLAVLLSVVSGNAAAANPELYCARQPVSTGGFIGTGGQWAAAPSRVTVARGEENNLKLRFEAEGSLVKAKCKKADSESIFADESAEFFLMPPDSEHYYHVAVNPLGTVYTARCVTDDRGHRRDVAWNPKIQVRAHAEKDRWIAELTFAPDAFEGAAFGNNTWRMNFARNVRDGSDVPSTSWTGSSDFNNPETFGRIHFDRGMQNHLEVLRVAGTRFSGVAFACAGAALTVSFEGREILRALPDPANRCVFAGDLPLDEIPIKGGGRLTFKLDSPNAPGEERSGTVACDSAGLIHPDAYYYTPGVNAVCDVTAAPEAPARMLEVHDDRGKTVRSIPLGRLTRVTIPLAGLAPGRYSIVFSATRNSRRIHTRRMIVIGYPQAAPVAGPVPGKLSAHGTELRINDQPVFLYGGSATRLYNLRRPDAFTLKLGAFPTQDHHVLLESLGGFKFRRQKGFVGYTVPPRPDFLRLLDRRLAPGTRRDNGLIRLAYEASMQLAEVAPGKSDIALQNSEYFARTYAEAKKRASDRLFSIQLDRPALFRRFRDTADVYEIACWSSSYAADMMPNLDRDMADARKLFAGRPIIFWLGGSIPRHQARTAEELRAGVYLALCNDLAGVVIHLGHDGIPRERQRLWSAISNIGCEINSFYADFRRGEPVPAIVNAPPNIRFAARRNGKDLHIIAVNLSGHSTRFDVKVNGATVPRLTGELTGFEPMHYVLRSK